MKLLGANRAAEATGLEELPGKSNYYIGNDPAKWRTNVPTFAKVEYENVYPGVDLVYYGNPSADGQLEYDFVVHPGADPKGITLEVGEGSALPPAAAGRPYISPNGDLVIETGGGEVRFHKPVVYQEQLTVDSSHLKGEVGSSRRATDNGPLTTGVFNRKSAIENRKFLDGHYVLTAGNRVQFEIPVYDKTRPLVIDPVLVYSTYLGGSALNDGRGIAVDSSGNAYITGSTTSTDFPTTSGALQTTFAGGSDAYVAKLNSDGSSLIYSTYLGGSGGDQGNSISVDSSGDAYVTGATASIDFPTTSGAAQRTCASCAGGNPDVFVAKLSADGSSLVYSTYLGGSSDDHGLGIALDSSGSAYVTGFTFSMDFPITSGAYQQTCGSCTGGFPDAFVSKLSADGSLLVYSTYLGGSLADFGRGIAVDSTGGAYVTGYTLSTNFPTTSGARQTMDPGAGSDHAFVSKLSANGSLLVYSTYLGGSLADFGQGIAVDSSGDAYITGFTFSTDFPTTSGAMQTTNAGGYDAFVAKLSADGSSLTYSTYLGGSSTDYGFAIAVDSSGDAYATGETISADFPTTNGAYQTTYAGSLDAFAAKLSSDGSSLTYSTYLGGSSSDSGSGIVVDSSGNAIVTGYTQSANFPTTSGALQTGCGNCAGGASFSDAFVAKFNTTVFFSPPSPTFGAQAVGTTSAAQTIVLNNQSGASVNIAGITVSGDFAISAAGTTCSTSTPVAAGGNCSVSITFTPTTIGSRTGTLSVADDAANSPQIAILVGTGANPAPGISPTSLSFGNQSVQTTTPPQIVTLTNSGSFPLTISGIAATSDFAETNTCGTSVAAGTSCMISVTFTPAVAGPLAETLAITDNAINSPQMVSLAGTGVPPAVTVNPTTLTFGSFGIGIASPLQAITVSNNGPGPLQVTGVTVSGDFSQTNNCIGMIAALASCTVNVTFTATAAGTRSGFVTITDDAVASPQTVTLTGTGIAPTATASPASLSFGNQSVGTTSTSQQVTLTNGASGPLTISSLGTSNGDFTQTNTCPIPPATLAASGTCMINVGFKPSVNGAESGTLTINDNASNTPQTVPLSGTGQAPVAALSTSSLDFPGQTVGMMSAPESVMLTNTGALALTVSGFVITSPFAQSNNCPASLAPGASCMINVTFTAAFAGTTYGSVIVSDNSLGSPSQTVSLTGEATVSFSPQLAGTTSAAQAVTVANGSATKTVTVMGIAATGDFAVASNNCAALPPGASCDPTVKFKPTMGGTRTGTLVISDTSPGSPHSVPLTGMGQDFAVTTTGQSSATVNPGGTATFTLSVAPQGGFNQTVNLSCTLPAMMTLATCNVSPMSVNPISATPVAATATITTAATEVAPRRVGDDETSPLQRPPRVQNLRNLWMILVAFTLIALALPARRRRAIQAAMGPALSPSASLRVNSAEGTSPLQRFALAMTLLLMLAWAACGGGANVTHMPGTPAGIYTITITAADPQANLTQTTTVKVTVSQ